VSARRRQHETYRAVSVPDQNVILARKGSFSSHFRVTPSDVPGWLPTIDRGWITLLENWPPLCTAKGFRRLGAGLPKKRFHVPVCTNRLTKGAFDTVLARLRRLSKRRRAQGSKSSNPMALLDPVTTLIRANLNELIEAKGEAWYTHLQWLGLVCPARPSESGHVHA
jgi:hypothetical protein